MWIKDWWKRWALKHCTKCNSRLRRMSDAKKLCGKHFVEYILNKKTE